VTAYERLRGHVLARSPIAGDARALVLLVREGIAAWIAPRAAAATAPAAPARSVEGPYAPADHHASLVRVLATMAMAHGGERSRR